MFAPNRKPRFTRPILTIIMRFETLYNYLHFKRWTFHKIYCTRQQIFNQSCSFHKKSLSQSNTIDPAPVLLFEHNLAATTALRVTLRAQPSGNLRHSLEGRWGAKHSLSSEITENLKIHQHKNEK